MKAKIARDTDCNHANTERAANQAVFVTHRS
nr:MAG TPA: hypothetical protein [Caudoviricetes sp.]